MRAKLTIKHKAMAYVLNCEFGYTMTKISELMSVSQATISNAIKSFKYEMTINNLQAELDEAKNALNNLGYYEQLPVIDIPVNNQPLKNAIHKK